LAKGNVIARKNKAKIIGVKRRKRARAKARATVALSGMTIS